MPRYVVERGANLVRGGTEAMGANCYRRVLSRPKVTTSRGQLLPSALWLADMVLCYAPYCFRNHAQPESYNNPLQNITVFNFFENAYISEIAKEITNNHGARNVVTGQPMVDTFVDSSILPSQPSPWKDCGHHMKKVIWAPHRSFFGVPGFLHTSTFMVVQEVMLELAEKYADCIQFAFKPHPSLRHNLMQECFRGKEKTEAYYRRRAEENAQHSVRERGLCGALSPL